MYISYFGLTENPFDLTPDPRFLFMSQRHREALAHLLFGMGEKGGFVLLTGEVGTGKTTLCRSLLEQVPEGVEVALVLNPKQTSLELVASLCDELKVSYPTPTESLKVLIDHLNRHLLDIHAKGKRTVVIIDEAQNLSTDVLEQVRLLTNLETTTRKLLQILLIGQPELQGMMAQPELRQLGQRVTARYHLTPLSPDETAAYIEHRLEVAGCKRQLFTRGTLHLIHRLSGGVPRLINTISDRALLGAYGRKRSVVNRSLARRAAAEVMGKKALVRSPGVTGWLLALLFLVLLGVGWFFLQNPNPGRWRAQWQEAPGKTATKPAVRAADEKIGEASGPIKSAILKKGDSGPDVRWLKAQLNRIEGVSDVSDGTEEAVFDDILEMRVMNFQRSNAVKADGIVGEQTLIQLTKAEHKTPQEGIHMSLILDALKRAERERKLEKAPDLSAIYQEGRLNRRKINPWFWAGGAFLIIFVLVAIISWPKAPSENDLKDKAPKPALADSAKAANAKTAGTASTQAKGSLPKDPSKPLSVAGKTVKDTTPSAPSAQKKRLETPKKAKQALSYIDLPREKTPELPAVAAPPPKKHIVDPKPVPEPVKQPVVLKSAKKRPTAAAKVVPKAQPKEALPLFDDLPEEIQSVLGPLEINVHMYSPNPPERRVFINMQGYREGDTIGESGFRLVEITSYGVVIDYGKGKALLEVKRKQRQGMPCLYYDWSQ